MPKVSDEYRRARRDEIVAGALRAFHRKGFAATSMADILEETGVSAGALYGHFKSKEELIKEVAASIVAGRILDADARLAIDPLPHPGELVGIILRGALAELKQPSMLVQLWGQAVTEPEFQSIAVSTIARLEKVFHRHISTWQQREHGLTLTDADHIATVQTPLFISVCQGFMLQLSIKPDFDIDEYLSAAAKYLPR